MTMPNKINILWVIPGLGIAFAVWWFFGGQAWLALHTGTDNCVNLPAHDVPVCRYYGFWSGFGSDLGEYVIVASVLSSLVLFWRTHTCPAHWWCWRRPTHALQGNEHYKLCHVHHPDEHMTLKEAIAHHCKMVEEELAEIGHRRVPKNG